MMRPLTVAIVLFFLITVSASQESSETVAPGRGGTIVVPTFENDYSIWNPLLANASEQVWSHFYPALIGINPRTMLLAPNVPGSLAAGWTYDDSGTELTITLREGLLWSDGVPITTRDYLYAYDATRSGTFEARGASALYELADGTILGGAVHSVVAVDEYTLRVQLGAVQTDANGQLIRDDDDSLVLTANCEALHDLREIIPVPAHIYEKDFGTDYAVMSENPSYVPRTENGEAVTFGAFTAPWLDPGVEVRLVADQTYPDTQLGFVSPGEWVLRDGIDPTQILDGFLAGEYTYITVPSYEQNRFRDIAREEGYQLIEYPASGYTFMAYNLADPTNPQPGNDENGNQMDQGTHPIFGDVRVRRAIAYAVDVQAMIGTHPQENHPATGLLEGNGYPIATHNHPGISSTDDELAALGVEPYPYDLERADALLVDAGWVDNDGDGVRECVDCTTAAQGTVMEFTLMTNVGGTLREAVAETIRQDLAAIGIAVNVEAVSFVPLVDVMLSQQFDAVLLGWSLSTPFRPGDSLNTFYSSTNDLPGTGLNVGSVQIAELDALIEQANSLPAAPDGSYPACDPATREQRYAEAQKILWEQQPYLFLFAGNTMIAAQPNLRNFDPLPYAPDWNMDAWVIEG